MDGRLDPLLDASAMRAVDSWAIERAGVASLDLMEAAGAGLAGAVAALAPAGPVRVVCGKGNNGGDGIVAARRLAELGFEADVVLLWPAGELSADAAGNLERWSGPVREVAPAEVAGALDGSGAIVDAIFGTGFDGAPRSPAAEAIEAINAAGCPVVAADIASGVDGSTGEVAGAAVSADRTVTFHALKLGHLIAPGKRHAGELETVDIGIPDGAPVDAPAGVITAAALAAMPRRGPDSTKFSSGQVLVAGGSRGLTGAVCLAAEAAGRAGAGYATVAVPAELEPVFEIKLTEVMSVGCPSRDGALTASAAGTIAAAAERAAAVVLGPGLGRRDDSAELVRTLASEVAAPLVLDADGLNAIAGDLEALARRAGPTVLTPHAGELGRLLDCDSQRIGERRLASAREAAERSGAIVVLKGDDTIVADPPGRIAVNALASPALATAGTGDVLTGILAALVARGLEPWDAVIAGVYAHARAGRIAAERIGAAESVVSPDVVDSIAPALRAGAGV